MRALHPRFNNTHTHIGLLNPNGTLTGANSTCLCFFKTESDQSIGKPFWEWWSFNTSSVNKIKKSITKAATGEKVRFDLAQTDSNGRYSHLDFTLTPVFDENKNITSLVVEFHDIQETQSTLVESDLRLQAQAELTSECYWEQDEHFRFSHFSQHIADIAGIATESLIGQCRWEIQHPDNAQMDWSGHQAALARQEPFREFEYTLVNDAGDINWISTSGNPIFDLQNNFKGYRGTSRNITKHKRAAVALKEAEQHLIQAINIAGIGIWRWDMVSDQVVWDAKQFDLFGIRKVDTPIPLATVTNAIHPDDREGLNKTAQVVMQGGVAALEEFRVIHPDGSVHWLLGGSSIVDVNETESSAMLIGINMDITKSKKNAIALRHSQNQLKKLNLKLENEIIERTARLKAEASQHKSAQSKFVVSRLESIGQLAGGVAHDFNNLMAVIGGNLELAAALVSDEERSEVIEDALKAVEDGAILTKRLLTYARKQRLSPTRISAGECVLESIQLLRRTLGEEITIIPMLDPDIWDVFVDPGEIQSALINLAVNARDAMSHGGTLTIEARNLVLGDEATELSADALPGEYVGMFVTDTGSGMTTEVIEHALEPFFTTKELGKGTGLGLSSVYGLVLESNGFLKLDSELGKGTRVQLYLPRASDQATSPPTPAETPQKQRTNGELVLVVEDNPRVRKVAVKRFAQLGYRTIEASTTLEAIDILKTGTPVALVFSDIVMPGGMNGYELSDWVSNNRTDLRVLLTSGYNDHAQRANSKAACKSVVLVKPYSINLLAQRVREAIESEHTP